MTNVVINESVVFVCPTNWVISGIPRLVGVSANWETARSNGQEDLNIVVVPDVVGP